LMDKSRRDRPRGARHLLRGEGDRRYWKWTRRVPARNTAAGSSRAASRRAPPALEAKAQLEGVAAGGPARQRHRQREPSRHRGHVRGRARQAIAQRPAAVAALRAPACVPSTSRPRTSTSRTSVRECIRASDSMRGSPRKGDAFAGSVRVEMQNRARGTRSACRSSRLRRAP
jgi:hypothetical protein